MTKEQRLYTNRKNIVLLASLSCLLWGSAYPSIKIGYSLFNIQSSDIGAKLLFAGYRFTLAGIIVLFYKFIKKDKIFSIKLKKFKEIILLGVMQTSLQYICFYIGMTFVTGVRGSILNAIGTFISILLAHFIYKNDKLNMNKIIGCIVGFAGVIIVNLNGQSFFQSGFTFKGEGLIMLATLFFAMSSIYAKKISKSIDSALVTGYQLFFGGIILIGLGIMLGGRLTNFDLKKSVLLIYMAMISSIAFVIWTQLLKYNKVGLISMFNFLVPVFGTLLSVAFLGENIFEVKIILSLILVCSGIFLVYKVPEVKCSGDINH